MSPDSEHPKTTPPDLTLEEAEELVANEKRDPIPPGKMYYVQGELKAGDGFVKLKADCQTLKDWSDKILEDKDIEQQAKTLLGLDREQSIKDTITSYAETIFNNRPIGSGINNQEEIANIIQVILVHNAIQLDRAEQKTAEEKDATQAIGKKEQAHMEAKEPVSTNEKDNENLLNAKKDFELLNTVVFRRYRMKPANQKFIPRLVQAAGDGKEVIESMLKGFFNPSEAFKQCQIEKENRQKTLRTTPEEITQLYKTANTLTAEETLQQLNEASVIALFKKTVEKGWIADYVEEKWPSLGAGTTLLRGLESGAGFIKSMTNLQQYGNDWQSRLIQEIKKNDNLTSQEKGSQIAALIRVMKDTPNTSKIGTTKYYTHDELVSKQIQALENAQACLEQQLGALDTKLDNNNSTACASIIDSMVRVAEKIDQTTQVMGENMYQNYSEWQKLFPNDSPDTETNAAKEEIQQLLTDLKDIKSQRTYNHCLETLKTLNNLVHSASSPKQAIHAKIITKVLRKQIAQAEKKGILRKFLDWLKQLVAKKTALTAETLLEAEPRSRWSTKKTHREQNIISDWETISSRLPSPKIPKTTLHSEAVQDHLSNTLTHHAQIQASNKGVDNKTSFGPSQEKPNDPALSSQEKTSNLPSTPTKKQ